MQIRGSIVVSISACHADDPGSIPGRGVFQLKSKETIWMQRHVRASFFGGFESGLFHLTHANRILFAHPAILHLLSFLVLNWKDNVKLFGGFGRGLLLR